QPGSTHIVGGGGGGWGARAAVGARESRQGASGAAAWSCTLAVVGPSVSCTWALGITTSAGSNARVSLAEPPAWQAPRKVSAARARRTVRNERVSAVIGFSVVMSTEWPKPRPPTSGDPPICARILAPAV